MSAAPIDPAHAAGAEGAAAAADVESVLLRGWQRRPGRMALATATGAALLAGLALLLASQPGSLVSPWMADAFGMVALLCTTGPRQRLQALAALLAGLALAGLLSGLGGATLLSWLPGHAAAMLLGARVLQVSPDRLRLLSSPRACARVGLSAVLLPALVAASLSVPLMLLAGQTGASAPLAWLNLVLGSLIGTLALLPLLLALLRLKPAEMAAWVDVDTLVLLCVSLGVAVLALLHLAYPFVYIGLPLLVAAVRLRFVQVSLLVLCVAQAVGAMISLGLLATPPTTTHWQDALVHLSVAMMLVPSLLLSASMGAALEREVALERERERYRRLYERTPAMMHSIGPDGRMLAVSRLWLERLGYDERDVVGRPSTDFLDAESRRRAIEQVIPAFLRSGECRDVEYRMVARDGGHLDVLLSAISEHDEQGRFIRSLAVLEDVTRKRLAEQLALQHRHTAAMLESIGDAVVGLDRLGRVRSLNPAAVEMIGWTLDEVRGRPWAGLLGRQALDGGSAPGDPVERCLLDDSRPAPVSCRLRCRDGRWRVVRETAVPLHEPGERGDAQSVGVVLTLQDITAAHDLERTLARQAHHDALTGLPNRLLLQDRLHKALQLRRRQHGRLALLFMDLDHFKQVNDRHGHDAGDALLRAVARRVQEAVRASDTVCRLGGDEFVVLLPQIEESPDARRVAQHILEAVDRPYRIGALELRVSFSIGIAVSPEDGDDEATLMRRADTAMYRVKHEGRHGLGFHQQGDTDLGNATV